MKKIWGTFLLVITLCLGASISCSQTEIPNTPTHTITPVPTSTITLTPTITPTPTPYTRREIGTAIPELKTPITIDNIGNIVQIAEWGYGLVSAAEYTPDGNLIIVGSSKGIYYFDPESLEIVRFINNQYPVHEIALSPDGKFLAAATSTDVLIYEFNTGELIKTIADKVVGDLEFSPEGDRLAIYKPGKIFLYRIDDWTIAKGITVEDDSYGDIAFSPDGKYLAAAGFGIQVWELDEDETEEIIPHTDFGVKAIDISFTNDSKNIVIGGWDLHFGWADVIVFRLSDGKISYIEDDNDNYYGAMVAISPDGNYVAESIGDLTIRSTSSLNKIKSFPTAEDTIHSIKWSLDGQYLTTTSEKNGLQIWNVTNGELEKSWNNFSRPINKVSWSPDGQIIATGGQEGQLIFWKSEDGSQLKTINKKREVTSLDFSPIDRNVAVGYNSGTLEIYDYSSSIELIKSIGEPSFGVVRAAFSPDGKYLAHNISMEYESRIRTITFLNTEGWESASVWRISGEFPTIDNMAFNPDGSLLAAAINKGSILFWNMEDMVEIEPIIPVEDSKYAYNVSFSPDGKFIAIASRFGNKFYIYKVSDGKLTCTYETNFKDSSRNFAWSPDSKFIVRAMGNGQLGFIQTNDCTEIYLTNAHTLEVRDLAFSPDGSILASVSQDGTVRLWGILP